MRIGSQGAGQPVTDPDGRLNFRSEPVTVDVLSNESDGAVARALDNRRGSGSDMLFRAALTAAAGLVLVVIGAIMVLLLHGGLPALMAFGPEFFVSTDWDPQADIYSAGVMLYGTIVTALIAILLAVPASL
eukprot:gene34637-40645_t